MVFKIPSSTILCLWTCVFVIWFYDKLIGVCYQRYKHMYFEKVLRIKEACRVLFFEQLVTLVMFFHDHAYGRPTEQGRANVIPIYYEPRPTEQRRANLLPINFEPRPTEQGRANQLPIYY